MPTAKKATPAKKRDTRVEKLILAAVTVTENLETDGATPHKFQIMRQGPTTTLQKAADSLGQNVCAGEAKYPTDALVEGVQLITHSAFKTLPTVTTKHKDVALAAANPSIKVKSIDGSNDLTLSRGDNNGNADSVTVAVAGYTFYFDEEDLTEVAELLSKNLEVRETRSASN